MLLVLGLGLVLGLAACGVLLFLGWVDSLRDQDTRTAALESREIVDYVPGYYRNGRYVKGHYKRL